LDITVFLFVSLLGIAAILFGVLRGKTEAGDRKENQELATSLQAFMDEFEKENAYLIRTVEQLKAELKRETTVNREQIQELAAKIEHLSQNGKTEKLVEEEATPAIVFNEHYSRVVVMAKEGRTPEQISKATGIGLGEIQMILSLIKQENTA
jgi:hypothetical protein